MKSGLVVLVPGTESTSEVTFSGLKPLLERDYDVELFDFYSAEELTPEQRFVDYTDQLQVKLMERQGRPVHLLGYSLGAHIALAVAADNAQVASLCLIAGWLKTDSLQAERHTLWLDLYDVDPALAGRLSHMIQYSSTYRSFLAEQQTATVLAPNVPNAEIRARVEVNRVLDSTEVARSLNIPTLLIAGKSDSKVAAEHTLELYGAVKTATLVQTTGGHALLRERLGQVYGTYFDFLQGKLDAEEVVDTLVP